MIIRKRIASVDDRNKMLNRVNECIRLAKKKEYKAWLGGKRDLLGIVQEIHIWTSWQMVYAQTRICSSKWDE